MKTRPRADHCWIGVAALLTFFPPLSSLAQPAQTSGVGATSRAADSPAADASGRCGVCHPQQRVEFEHSRHAREEVRCISCHAGNDQSLDIRTAHGSGFKGRPARQSIPSLCASCHSNQAKMGPYNLPVDQHALYQTSGHGIRLASGDTRVAVCSDCHGAHEILPATDPASRVYVLNIPRTCGGCHGDTTLMRRRGRPDVYREYLNSTHARALFDHGNLRAPTCVSCHGSHGAGPPGIGDVEKVCGQCHTAERRYFVSGPHRAALTKAGLPECASCHSDHAIQASQSQHLSTTCTKCHGADSPAAGLGRKMRAEYVAAAAEIDTAEALIRRAEAVPIQTEDYHARIEQARTYLRETLPATHAAQEEVVASFTSRAHSVGREVRTEIGDKLGQLRVRRYVLVLFWFYVILTVIALRRIKGRGAGTQ